MENNQYKKIYFSGDKSPFDIVSEILGKNNLKETLGDAMNKIRQGKVSIIETLYKLSQDLAEGKIIEKDFILSIQKQLETSPAVAQNINKDIKEKLLPLAESADTAKQNLNLSDKKLENINLPQKLANNSQTNGVKERKPQQLENNLKEQGVGEIRKPPSKMGPDNYREPIE